MKLIRRLFLFLAAALFVYSAVGYISAEREQSRKPENTAGETVSTDGWLVSSDGDRVRVQPLSGGRPRYVEGLRVSDLPEQDRQQLSLGLCLPDDAALLALLEDYTG